MGWPTNALIIDDEPHVRIFLRMVLKELGITQTWEAGDGATGVQMTVSHKPEIVLLDVNLPVMNGLQALAELRHLEPDIPVVMMTSQTAIGSVREASRLGAAGYVLKHLPKEQTLASLAELFDSLDDSGGN